MANVQRNMIKYLYKVVGARPVFSLPLTEPLPLSADDARDGFIHLSTASQIPFVLDRFFSNEVEVTILRLMADRLQAWKKVQWEGVDGGEMFPHLYGSDIENSDVSRDGARTLKRSSMEEKSWAKELESIQGWLE